MILGENKGTVGGDWRGNLWGECGVSVGFSD